MAWSKLQDFSGPQTHIVNLNLVRSFSKMDGGGYLVQMVGEAAIHVRDLPAFEANTAEQAENWDQDED